uniref:Ragulator complex protein LAMTOR5 n=1 Tax=Macrostomum lignano TaxID=282301 RepID=A0A1I8HEW7_9PLAT
MDSLRRFLESYLSQVDGLSAILLSDRDGVGLMSAAQPECQWAVEAVVKRGLVPGFCQAAEQAGKLGVGPASAFVTNYGQMTGVTASNDAVDDAVGRSSIALATSATPSRLDITVGARDCENNQSAFRGRNEASAARAGASDDTPFTLSPVYEQPINESQLIPDDDYATNDNSIDAADITSEQSYNLAMIVGNRRCLLELDDRPPSVVSLIAFRARDPIFQTSGSRVDCHQSRVRVQQVRARELSTSSQQITNSIVLLSCQPLVVTLIGQPDCNIGAMTGLLKDRAFSEQLRRLQQVLPQESGDAAGGSGPVRV